MLPRTMSLFPFLTVPKVTQQKYYLAIILLCHPQNLLGSGLTNPCLPGKLQSVFPIVKFLHRPFTSCLHLIDKTLGRKPVFPEE